jgi:hypothetical protein
MVIMSSNVMIITLLSYLFMKYMPIILSKGKSIGTIRKKVGASKGSLSLVVIPKWIALDKVRVRFLKYATRHNPKSMTLKDITTDLSPSGLSYPKSGYIEFMRRPKIITQDKLRPTEQMILSVRPSPPMFSMFKRRAPGTKARTINPKICRKKGTFNTIDATVAMLNMKMRSALPLGEPINAAI